MVLLQVKHSSNRDLYIDGDADRCLATFVNANANTDKPINMVLYEVEDPDIDLKKPSWVCMYNPVPIKAGDELLGDYGDLYDFVDDHPPVPVNDGAGAHVDNPVDCDEVEGKTSSCNAVDDSLDVEKS